MFLLTKKIMKPMRLFLYALAIAALLCSGCYGLNGPSHPSTLPLSYHNEQYDFTFFLPASWQGYSVLTQQWNGQTYSPGTDKVVETEHGPVIVLRHPQWAASDPYYDIPILVMTRNQWKADKQGQFTIFSDGLENEIAHNAKYVFAIWSRFNWNESIKGSREVEGIVIQNQTANGPHLDPR
jgi:hypothetical protein